MKSNKTRERILDVSLRLFNEKKASNVSTVQISAAMKISPGNLYYYYANKEEVIRCIWNERMIKSQEELLAKTETVKNTADLLDYIEAGLEYIVDYKFFYTEMPTLFTNDNELIKMYGRSEKKAIDAISQLYDTWTQEGKTAALSRESKCIFIENSIALAHKIVSSYEVAAIEGKLMKDFMGISWLHMAAMVKPYLTAPVKDELERELARRGFSEKEYMEIKYGTC